MYGVVVFFFQAEDGIRDTSVTGVQTCALPISDRHISAAPPAAGRLPFDHPHESPLPTPQPPTEECLRSEERRVGKECRSRGGAARHEQKGAAAGGPSSSANRHAPGVLESEDGR